MPITYEIGSENRLVLVTGTGTITGRDVLGHLRELSDDPGYSAPMLKLVDYRNVKDLQITPNEAVTIASTKEGLQQKFKDERCAFISPGDATYGISRVHHALIDSADITTAVFRLAEDALGWLGLPLDFPIKSFDPPN